ncbi:ParA family protein [Vibrio splendidus]
MAKVVGFISEKGGVGKTTSCYHIAIALCRYHHKKVLVIDADYQRGGITGRLFPEMIESFGSVPPNGETLFTKYQQLYSASSQTPDIDIYPHTSGIDVIPADYRLSNVTTNKLPSSNNIRENNLLTLTHLRTIRFVLEPILDDYDYILIDSHPEVSDVMRSIICAADYCVSPVKLDRQSSIGVATVIGEISNVNADVKMVVDLVAPQYSYMETIFSGAMGMMAREYNEELKQTERQEFQRLRRTGPVFENYVTEGDGLRIAAMERCPVYDVTNQNAYKQSGQLRSLTMEFLGACQ